jgi:hypothetical protein
MRRTVEAITLAILIESINKDFCMTLSYGSSWLLHEHISDYKLLEKCTIAGVPSRFAEATSSRNIK